MGIYAWYISQLDFQSDGLNVEEATLVFAVTALATRWSLGLVTQTMERSHSSRPLWRHLVLLAPLLCLVF
jgi:hypothetical protein